MEFVAPNANIKMSELCLTVKLGKNKFCNLQISKVLAIFLIIACELSKSTNLIFFILSDANQKFA